MLNRLFIYLKKIIPRKIFLAFQPVYHFILSWFSSVLYGQPSEKMIVIGVTGTTGKTTSVYLIAKTLEEAGLKVGFTSTAIFNDGHKEWLNDKKMTMAGRMFTQKILSDMHKNGCQAAIVETTSEGVKQFRHRFINYDILVITGLYPEHIEAHGSFANYQEAKGKLFAHLKKCRSKYINEDFRVVKTKQDFKKLDYERVKKTIVVNLDDKYADYFLNFWAEKRIGFVESKNAGSVLSGLSIKDLEILTYGNLSETPVGLSFAVENILIEMQIIGAFNATNAMSAYCVAKLLKVGQDKIKNGLEKIEGVAGRLEKISEGQNFTVIVDYAFEPHALLKLYETTGIIPHKKIIHVLGAAGGGRDIFKRPILGKIAGKSSDIVIVTNEDPYDDDPQIIIDQVALGAEKSGKKINQDLYKIIDRREAIQKSLDLAEEGDIVLITGKGSEQAIMCKDGEKIPWDDRAIVRGMLAGKYKNKNTENFSE
jgi:UDP-N-acetylmuramoyl-L-alanyl-D-glutamate--2,6-diaminopimelate ligase